MKTVIKVECVDQTLQLTTAPTIACGGRDEDRVEFSFCSLWEGFTRTAVFWRLRGGVYHVQLDEADSCLIPAEVLQTRGVLHFGVFGVNPDGVRRTSEELTYRIAAGAITEGTQPPDPTPELYTQVLAAATAAQAIAQSVRDDADAGLFDGDPYVLTDADKADIVRLVLEALEGGGVIVPDLQPSGVIPTGATYTVAATGAVLTAGDAFPATVENGDEYTYGDYKYTGHTYPDGWKVTLNEAVTDRAQETYGAILESINGAPILFVTDLYNGCANLTTAPVIPASVAELGGCFSMCKNLKTYVGAPKGTADGNFSGYIIPAGVKSINQLFYSCESLTIAPVIPEGVTDIQAAFNDCIALDAPPVIPNSVTDMERTFFRCLKLTTAPVIPDGVKTMQECFSWCKSLTTAPVIPGSVRDMDYAFNACEALAGSIIINATPTYYEGCLQGTQITEILGACGNKEAILATK